MVTSSSKFPKSKSFKIYTASQGPQKASQVLFMDIASFPF
jgi:hypothetical protein